MTPGGTGPDAAREASLRRLHALSRTINGDLDLGRTLDAVCHGVVDGLGFEVAVVNLVMPDGALEVVSVAGSQSAHDALFGTSAPRREWDLLLDACTPVGDVLVDYDHTTEPHAVAMWVPDTPVSDEPDAWHPLDGLFAPLRTASSGLLGVISVDVPRDGRRPGADALELLEMYAAQASLAIENAQLHTGQVQLVEKLSALVSEAPVAILEFDLDGLIREWNPEAERVFGWSREEVLGRRNPMVEVDGYAARVADLLQSGGTHRQQARRRRKDGSLVDVEITSKVLFDEAGQPFGYIGALVDVSDRVALEQELRTAAFTDSLTGLANRARFRQALEAAASVEEQAWLLLLDLDGFKAVNDSLGHNAGDALLVEVAARLVQACHGDDLAARLGGDEFVVLLRGDEAAATALAARLVDRLGQPFVLDGRPVSLGCSIGLARIGETGDGGALRAADIAMYAAKSAGKARYLVFSAALADGASARADLAADLALAVVRNELSLRWHPVVETRSRRIVGVEALVRWEHPELGELAPGAFIALAESTGMVVPLGEWVLLEACRQVRAWQEEVGGCAELAVSVNLSPVQLRHPDVVEHVRAALAATGLAPELLVLELTEDVLLDDLDAAVAVLGRLRELGVRLAIDDFGAGYSSLRYLRRLPVDIVKLDRGLLEDADADPDARALVEAVLGLTRTLGRTAVAEGVETLPQLQVLEELRCPLAQGFLVAQPLRADEAASVLGVGWPVTAVRSGDAPATALPLPRPAASVPVSRSA